MRTDRSKTATASYTAAGLLRRVAAAFYDLLILLAVLMLATALALLVARGELDHGSAVFRAYLLLVCFLFYGWFWVHGGQTVGMRAWKIRVQQPDGRGITWKQALFRFLAAIPSWLLLGAGMLWILADREKMALHDRLSATVVARTSHGQY